MLCLCVALFFTAYCVEFGSAANRTRTLTLALVSHTVTISAISMTPSHTVLPVTTTHTQQLSLTQSLMQKTPSLSPPMVSHTIPEVTSGTETTISGATTTVEDNNNSTTSEANATETLLPENSTAPSNETWPFLEPKLRREGTAAAIGVGIALGIILLFAGLMHCASTLRTPPPMHSALRMQREEEEGRLVPATVEDAQEATGLHEVRNAPDTTTQQGDTGGDTHAAGSPARYYGPRAAMPVVEEPASIRTPVASASSQPAQSERPQGDISSAHPPRYRRGTNVDEPFDVEMAVRDPDVAPPRPTGQVPDPPPPPQNDPPRGSLVAAERQQRRGSS